MSMFRGAYTTEVTKTRVVEEDISNETLVGEEVTDLILDEVEFKQVTYIRVDEWKNSYYECLLLECEFKCGDIYTNTYRECHFSHCKFENMNIANNSFIDCKFTNCEFEKGDMTNNSFIDCIFIDCKFIRNDLSHTIFNGCNFIETNVTCNELLMVDFFYCGIDSMVAVGNLGDNHRTLYYFYEEDLVVCGCFQDRLEEFKKAVKRKYGKRIDNSYEKAIKLLELYKGES